MMLPERLQYRDTVVKQVSEYCGFNFFTLLLCLSTHLHHTPYRCDKRFCHPWNRYSDVTNGNRLNIQNATGRPRIVSAKNAAAFAHRNESHQPTSTK